MQPGTGKQRQSESEFHSVPVDRCRVCGQRLFREPLLHYKNMPKAAQFLPEAESLDEENGVDLEVRQCSGCGLVQLNNDPVPYYREVVRAVAFSREMNDFRTKQFARLVSRFSLEGKKVIEIGCGRGEYLSIMNSVGAKGYGLEYSKESVSHCEKNGLSVSHGFIDNEDCRLNNRPFSAFYILNFLEHLPKPNDTLRGIRNNLTDGAVGLLEVPNFDMIVRNNLFSEFTCDHLFYFTKETLSTTLSLNGFEIIDCGEEWYQYIISCIVRKRATADLSSFHEQQSRIERQIQEYIGRFPTGKVAVWGAGHQAFAVIALMGLAGKIRYVVDSAPFKQGKYTPASHIPIVSPERLCSDPVDAVIVMAASYSDEVAGIIRQDFDKNMSVSILRDFGLEIV